MKYLIIILFWFPVSVYADSLVSKQIWVFRSKNNLSEYVELYKGKDTIYGNYYGYFIEKDSQVVYFKAPIIFIKSKTYSLYFKVEKFLYAYQAISPLSTGDSSSYFDIKAARLLGVNRAPFLFAGDIIDNKLSLRKTMGYGGGRFDKLEFDKLDVD